MYELVKAAENTYYIESPSKMGLFVSDGEVLLIDSGNGRDSAKRALRHIDEQGWTLRAIINTHCHADHIGGNAHIRAQTGVPAYSAGINAAISRDPMLGVGLLYGGFPPKELKNRQMLAQSCGASDIAQAVLPEGLELLNLPGHCPDMLGISTPDGVCFIADSLSGEQVLEKYHVTLVYDVAAHLETLTLLEGISTKLFVPSHAPATEDIRTLVAANRNKTLEIADLVLALADGGRSAEDILKGVFEQYDIAMNINQYTLLKTTILSYLSFLIERGLVELGFSENKAIFRRI